MSADFNLPYVHYEIWMAISKNRFSYRVVPSLIPFFLVPVN